MSNSIENILQNIDTYYSERIKLHGACARGVDWNGEKSQYLRFDQLLKIIEINKQKDVIPISLNDFGCGYGALMDYLYIKGMDFNYHGFDLSNEMIETAKSRKPVNSSATYVASSKCHRVADYSVASGLFNVRQDIPISDWESFTHTILEDLNACSLKGFSFNCLSSYSDTEKMQSYLYYGDPCFYFDYCKRHFSSQVTLLHDYGLYEFTILVRK